jgi:D-alanyl-D-alanine carboxypeptidase
MTDTYFDGEEPARGTLAHGFLASGQDVSKAFDPSWAWSAGAMVSTVGDLTTWADALYAGDVLSKASRAEMIADPIPTDQDGVGYGLGVFVLDPAVAVDVAIGHGGDIPGYHTQMWYWPNEKYTVVGIVNSDAADSNELLIAALDALFDLDQ